MKFTTATVSRAVVSFLFFALPLSALRFALTLFVHFLHPHATYTMKFGTCIACLCVSECLSMSTGRASSTLIEQVAVSGALSITAAVVLIVALEFNCFTGTAN